MLVFNLFCELGMAFSKTGISFSPPRPLEVGTERDGKVWDGDKWVSKEDWEKVETKSTVQRLLDK